MGKNTFFTHLAENLAEYRQTEDASSTGHLSRNMNNEYNVPHVCVDLAALPHCFNTCNVIMWEHFIHYTLIIDPPQTLAGF